MSKAQAQKHRAVTLLTVLNTRLPEITSGGFFVLTMGVRDDMRIFLALILFILSSHAKADTWAEQQQRYNEMAQQREKLFQQQEELERLKRESERQKQELLLQGIESEQLIRGIKEQTDELLRQREADSYSWKLNEERRSIERESVNEEKYQELKANNEKAATKSLITLDEDYYARMTTQLVTGDNDAKLKFPFKNARTITETHKAYMYRIARKAQAGESEAEYKLGKSYYEGDGVKLDYKKAAEWLHKAAKQNNPEAQYGLFRMYTYGQGVKVDYDYAATMLRSAAENGHFHAQKLIDDIKQNAIKE